MRDKVPEKLEIGRIREGIIASDSSAGFYGAFQIKRTLASPTLRIIASAGELPEEFGWEHVSVSLSHRTPTWEEMSFIKDLCWPEEECVLQFHPPRALYVNYHPNCLHLWRKKGASMELPPPYLIGPKLETVVEPTK